MKDAHFAEQEHAYPRTLPLADFRPESYEQRLYVGPADRAVDGTREEQFVRRDPATSDVILSRKPDSWDGLFELYGSGEVPDDFMGGDDRDRCVAVVERQNLAPYQEPHLSRGGNMV